MSQHKQAIGNITVKVEIRMLEIDAVITWVDGNDPDWIRAKDSYIEEHFSVGKTKNGGVNRYRDWRLLPFWFRAVEQFIPWVRMIHFVTWGHIPDFLNLDNKKLHVVRHEDFIPDKYLPTFSSRPIELNLHRIPGLSTVINVFVHMFSTPVVFAMSHNDRTVSGTNPI